MARRTIAIEYSIAIGRRFHISVITTNEIVTFDVSVFLTGKKFIRRRTGYVLSIPTNLPKQAAVEVTGRRTKTAELQTNCIPTSKDYEAERQAIHKL